MVWAGGLDATYRAAIARPHTAYNRVDVVAHDGTLLYSDLPYSDGSVRATLTSRVARTLSLSLDASWFPLTSTGAVDPDGLLAPFGNRIKAYRGILYGDGSRAVFPVFYGRIEQVQLKQDGSVSLTGADLAADVVDAVFETPESSVTTNTISEEFVRLVQGALPVASFGASDETAALIAPLTWQTDRAQALDDMSATVGMTWYPLADGEFVQRLSPWNVPDLTPVLTLTDGTNQPYSSDGEIADWTVTVSRTGVYNSVVYTSERQDGTAPVYAIVHDLDPASPTYYLGNFGKKPYLVQNQAALTQTQCNTAANVTLKQAKSITQVWDPVAIVPDASLELGDLLLLGAGAAVSQQVITGFSLPLRETGAMSLSLRAYAPVAT